MRTRNPPNALLRLTILMALCGGVVLVTASPTLAKGPFQAVVEGPGMDPTPVRYPGSGSIGPLLAGLIEDSGFFAQFNGTRSPSLLRHRPTGELGPRYKITYTFGVRGAGRDIVQFVYPHAKAGPVTFMPPGQSPWEGETTTGGWYRADQSLGPVLTDIGVPAESKVATAGEVDTDAGLPSLLIVLGGGLPIAAAAILLMRLLRVPIMQRGSRFLSRYR